MPTYTRLEPRTASGRRGKLWGISIITQVRQSNTCSDCAWAASSITSIVLRSRRRKLSKPYKSEHTAGKGGNTHAVRQEPAPVTPAQALREAVVDVVYGETSRVLGVCERHGVLFLCPRDLSDRLKARPLQESSGSLVTLFSGCISRRYLWG